MMSRYYRVIKDHPLWDVGAILELNGNSSEKHYLPISDLWNKEIKDVGEGWWEGQALVENQPEWFERVYNVSVLGKAKYLAKDAARAAHEKLHRP
jgi:hypothetical protein